VLLRAIALHCAHHTFAATEKVVSPSTPSTEESWRFHLLTHDECYGDVAPTS